MKELQQIIGVEGPIDTLPRTLLAAATQLKPPATGALHVTCADESEYECVNAFQNLFVQHVLPPLKFAHCAAFRLANLGGQYEWTAARLAEQHFATAKTRDAYKLLVIKINAHVGVSPTAKGRYRLGALKRYETDSPCCGALHSLLGGGSQPYTQPLGEVFGSEGLDRTAILMDPKQVDPPYRNLYAAIVSARLQARKAILDIQDYQPTSPTLYWVLPCVTINRMERDTEIACGYYLADGRSSPSRVEYYGLSDDPSAYKIRLDHGRFRVLDPTLGSLRPARNHRVMAHKHWQKLQADQQAVTRDDRFMQAQHQWSQTPHPNPSKILERMLLPTLVDLVPVPAAVLLFAHGIAGIHHAFRVHRMADDLSRTQDALTILDEVRAKIDQLEPDRAQALVELLIEAFRGVLSPRHGGHVQPLC